MENEKGIVKLTRKQLYDEIWALSVAGVARKYNLNYGKLIATCKVENISFPSSGYWTKKNMGKDVSNEIVEFSGLEDTEISLITKDAVVKRIRKAKAEVVEKVHTDVTEELDVVTEEDLPQKKTDNIPEWPDGILDYLDETERNKVLDNQPMPVCCTHSNSNHIQTIFCLWMSCQIALDHFFIFIYCFWIFVIILFQCSPLDLAGSSCCQCFLIYTRIRKLINSRIIFTPL